MARSRKSFRPTDPMQIAARRAEMRERERLASREPEQWGVDTAALALPTNGMVSIGSDAAGRISRARRQDIFDVLKARGKLSAEAHGAIRRLQNDISVLHRDIGGGGNYSPRVDRSRSPSQDSFTEIRHQASLRIEAVLSLSGPASARLLGVLGESTAALGPAMDWRMLVRRETRETLPDAQGAILRGACENLAGAYAIIDRRREPAFARSMAI
jgi:hypothetical protein